MKKILIADDAAFVRVKLASLLKNMGFEVVEAENGQVAVDKYKSIKPDMIFLDITMPVKDGLSALKEIMQHDKDAKVVMLTNVGDQRVIMEAISAGARDYNLKPFNDEKIKKIVDNIFNINK